jgi:hypothetical protein
MKDISLYEKTLEITRHKRSNNQIEDKDERLRQQQCDYYHRKGFFNEYKKKVCKKLKIEYTLKEIDSVESLEAWATDYLQKNYNITIHNGKAVAYILRVL